MSELTIPVWAWIVTAIVLVPLAVLLFRSACDLCSVEPPGWLKCLVIVVIVALIGSAIAFPMRFGVAALNDSSTWVAAALAVALSLPIQAVLIPLLYKFVLRTRFVTALLIWGIQLLLSTLVLTLLLLLVAGGFTIVEGIDRVT